MLKIVINYNKQAPAVRTTGLAIQIIRTLNGLSLRMGKSLEFNKNQPFLIWLVPRGYFLYIFPTFFISSLKKYDPKFQLHVIEF